MSPRAKAAPAPPADPGAPAPEGKAELFPNPLKRRGPGRPRKDTRPPRSHKAGAAAATRGKKDLSDGIAALWAMGGAALSYPLQWVTLEDGRQVRMAYSPAAGKVMQVQAPMAGRELNKWVKDHDVIYRLVEPILGQQGLNVIMSVMAPPLIVGILEHKPEAAPFVMPILGPMLFEIWKESRKQAARSEEMMADLLAEGEDAGEEFAAWMEGIGFGGSPVPEPEPEPAPVP